MNPIEQQRLDYEMRLREAPSIKLWTQYARWEASHNQVGAACAICERYLSSTASPAEEMWLLYTELSPSHLMKLDILSRAINQQPLSTRLHHCILRHLISPNHSSSSPIVNIEHILKCWMDNVLKHGSPNHLEDLFDTLVEILEKYACSDFIQQYEDLVLLLLHTYASMPVAKNTLSFAFNTIKRLIGQSQFDKRKLFINALKLFSSIFSAISSLSEQYSALHDLYLLYEFLKSHFHPLFFAETLVCNNISAHNTSSDKSAYAILFAARANLEVAPSLSVPELCLLLAYDSVLTLQVDDRICCTSRCSIFNVISSEKPFDDSWIEWLSTLQKIVESDLFLYRKDIITNTMKKLVSSRGNICLQSINLSNKQLAKLYSTVHHLCQRFSFEHRAFEIIVCLLDITLPIVLSSINLFFGLIEGLVRMLLASSICTQFTDKIITIMEKIDVKLFDSETIQLFLRAVVSTKLITKYLTITVLSNTIACSILNGDTTMIVNILLLVCDKWSCFTLFESVVRVIFDNSEAKGMFSITIRSLVDITSTLISDVSFRDDALAFLRKIGSNLDDMPIENFLECSAIILLLFLVCMTQQLSVNHIFEDENFANIVENILKRVEIIHMGIRIGDITLVEQYAKLSCLIGTVFEYHELITGLEEIAGRIALECEVIIRYRNQNRPILLYEIIPGDRSDGHGLLALLKN